MCPKEKIAVPANGSSNGVDAETLFNPINVSEDETRRFRGRFNIPDHALVIGFVGRIVAGKGVKELARAWEGIRCDHDDVYMITAGPREAQDPVPQEILDLLRNDDRVFMIDFLRRDEMPVFYSAVDLIAFPSYSEGFPNVPLEAAAMELPVVAGRVTGCVDAVVDGLTGTLVSAQDSASLEHAIRAYLDDRLLREAHGKAARERVLREFRPEPVWEAVLSEYALLLKARGLSLPDRYGTGG
jgi:glycosyltransferase involved in cell wall biosynthesis